MKAATNRQRSSAPPRERRTRQAPRARDESHRERREEAAETDRACRATPGNRPVRFQAERTARELCDGRMPWGQTAAMTGRSLRRNLTLADLSWPQAARMSRPRGVRTGAA